MSLLAKYEFFYNVPAPLGLIWSNEEPVERVEEIDVDIVDSCGGKLYYFALRLLHSSSPEAAVTLHG